MLFVLFTLEDFIGVRKLSRARESSPPRSARGRHSAGAVGHSVGGKVAVTTNRWEVQHETWRSVAIRTLRRRPPTSPEILEPVRRRGPYIDCRARIERIFGRKGLTSCA